MYNITDRQSISGFKIKFIIFNKLNVKNIIILTFQAKQNSDFSENNV